MNAATGWGAHVLRDTASVGKRTPTLLENSKLLNVALVPCSMTMEALRIVRRHHVSLQRRRRVVNAKQAALQGSPQRRRCTGVLSAHQDGVRVGSMVLPASGRLTG